MAIGYDVPGLKVVLQQPTSLVCWATAYTMMRSWNDQRSYEIRDAVARVDEKYGKLVDNNQALPSSEFTAFLAAANMRHEPMASLPMQGWLDLLQTDGLLWVGTLGVVSPGTYLHSRLVEGMRGDGTSDNTFMKIIDPENGSRYEESFSMFIRRYEGAFTKANPSTSATLSMYYQIRHF